MLKFEVDRIKTVASIAFTRNLCGRGGRTRDDAKTIVSPNASGDTIIGVIWCNTQLLQGSPLPMSPLALATKNKLRATENDDPVARPGNWNFGETNGEMTQENLLPIQ